MKTAPALIFDLAGTLVKMRPATLLVERCGLKKLRRRWRLAIITGAKRQETINILRKLKIDKYFTQVITKDDTIFRKPNKGLYVLLKKRLRCKKAVYVGDTMKDGQLARRAKIPFLYVGKRNIGIYQSENINQLLGYLSEARFAMMRKVRRGSK